MISARFVCRIIAAVLCGATVPLAAATPAQASPAGLEMVTVSTPFNSVNFKTIAAVCPRGKKVIGGGGTAYTQAGSGLLITQSYPDGTGNQFIVAAFEDESGTPETWRLTSYAICASPLPGLEYVSTPFYSNISGTWAVCPSGKKLIGMGGQVIGGDGQVALVGLFPGSTSLTRSETWVTKDPNGYSGTYQVRATSVCADPIGSLQYVVTSVSNTTGAAIWVACPFGKRVLSSGARLANGAAPVWHGEAKLSLMSPTFDLTTSLLGAQQFLDSGQTFTAQVIAICA